MSWGSVLSGWASSQGQAANQEAQGRNALTNGIISRRNAYQQAQQMEYTGRQKSLIAAMNMERMSRNRTAQMDAALAAQGGSGFTGQDSGTTNEQEVGRQMLQQLVDMNTSNAIEDSTLRFDATLQRVSGDQQLRVAQNEAEYQQRMARITRRTGNVQALIGAGIEGISTGVQAYQFFSD